MGGALPSAQETAIPVVHTRASKVLARMFDIVEGIPIRPDDRHGFLYVKGNPDTVAQIRGYVNVFDVRPRLIGLQALFDSPADKLITHTSTEIQNNRVWHMDDADTDVKVALSARINDDGTFTTFIESSTRGKSSTIVVRIRQGEQIYLRPGRMVLTGKGPVRPPASPELKEADEQTVPIVRIDLQART